MNKDTARDYLPLVQALSEGKVIQYWHHEGRWEDVGEINMFANCKYYRIKPEPREIWVNHYYNPCRLDQICDSQEEANQRAILGQLFCQKRYREVIE